MTASPQWYSVAAVGTLVLTGAVVLGTRKVQTMLETDQKSSSDRFLSSRYSEDKDIQQDPIDIEMQPTPSPQRFDLPAPAPPSPGPRKSQSQDLDKEAEPEISIIKSESSQRLFSRSTIPVNNRTYETSGQQHRESKSTRDGLEYYTPPQARHMVRRRHLRYQRPHSPPPRSDVTASAANFLMRSSLPSGVNVRLE